MYEEKDVRKRHKFFPVVALILILASILFMLGKHLIDFFINFIIA